MQSLALITEPEDIQDNHYRVYIATWSERILKPVFATMTFPGAYGIVILGHGERREHWGAGYATSDDILRAEAIRWVLEKYSTAQPIDMFTRGLIDQIKVPDGHVRGARERPDHTNQKGQPFDGFAVLDEITKKMDARKWTLHQVVRRKEPFEFLRAQKLAETIGKDTAHRYSPFFSVFNEEFPRNHIIATDENPDPHDLERFPNKREPKDN